MKLPLLCIGNPLAFHITSHKPVNIIEILLINEKVNKTDIKRVEMFYIDNS